MSNYLEIFGDIAWIATIVSGIAAGHYYCDKNKYALWVRWVITLTGIIATICYFGSKYTYPKEFIRVALIAFIIIPIFYGLRRKMIHHKSCKILEEPEGQVPLDSKFYLERPGVESECYKTILKPNALICIKAPRQMGKTSLMTRILHHAEKGEKEKDSGCRAISLSFQKADSDSLANLDKFLRWFCERITRKLNLPVENVSEQWTAIYDSKTNCDEYLENLIKAMDKPLVLGLDEVDQIFEHQEIAKDFFGLVRSWHEQGKNDEIWKKLRFVLVHSKEVYIFSDVSQSPFNVGTPVELPEFTNEQIGELAKRHGLNWTEEQTDSLTAMVGGHPYLVRLAFYEIACGHITLEKLLKDAPTDSGIYYKHLHRHLMNLQGADQNLVKAMKQVVSAEGPVVIEAKEKFKLRSMGLIKFQGNAAVPLCGLYYHYFRTHL